MRTLIGLLASTLALSGCQLLAPYNAHVTADELNTFLPFVQELRIESYVSLPNDCEYLKYARGAFSTKPDNEFCAWFAFHEDESWKPQPFDEQARADLKALHREYELRRASFPGSSLDVRYDATGAVAKYSWFAFAPCDNYVYAPGWTTLPTADELEDGVVAVGLDANWYKFEGC